LNKDIKQYFHLNENWATVSYDTLIRVSQTKFT